MAQVQAMTRLRIHDGKLSEFKEVAARCIDSVRAKDEGTLQYDWFLDAAGTECVVRETYRDSDAVFEHMANLGDTLGELLALCKMELEIYGSPSAALAGAMTDVGARIYAPLSLT